MFKIESTIFIITIPNVFFFLKIVVKFLTALRFRSPAALHDVLRVPVEGCEGEGEELNTNRRLGRTFKKTFSCNTPPSGRPRGGRVSQSGDKHRGSAADDWSIIVFVIIIIIIIKKTLRRLAVRGR